MVILWIIMSSTPFNRVDRVQSLLPPLDLTATSGSCHRLQAFRCLRSIPCHHLQTLPLPPGLTACREPAPALTADTLMAHGLMAHGAMARPRTRLDDKNPEPS